MTVTQLYIAIGLPTLALLLGVMFNGALFLALNSRLSAVDSRLSTLDNRMTSLESKFDVRFDMLLSKIVDIDNRLTRVEERLEHMS